MPKGPDPRATPPGPEQLPQLVREGATLWNARRFWHAHESWESAWHGLRALGDEEAAEFLHGLILCAAALENATRGKEEGFKRQFAEGLYLLGSHREGAARVGIDGAAPLLDALALLYADACRRRDWAWWNASGWTAPTLVIA